MEVERKFSAELSVLGKRISKLRKARGSTIEKLAYETSISKGNLSDIEQGRRNPRYCTLRAIATGLELTVSQLLEGL